MSETLVYLGGDPESLLRFVNSDAVDREVTLSVAPSRDAAVSAFRSPWTDCIVVDDTVADLDRFLSRLASEGPQSEVVVRATESSPSAYDGPLDPHTIQASDEVDDWVALLEHLDPHEQAGAATDAELGSTDGTFTESLQWHNPESDPGQVAADSLARRLSNTPTVVDTFLDNLLDIFFVIDLNLNFRLWNDRFNRVSGYTDEEIAGLTPLDFIVEDHHERAVDGIERIIEQGQATAEFDIRTRDGSVIPYSFTGSLIEDEEGPYISGIGREITERKEREQELRRERDLTSRIVETSPMAIFVMEADGSIVRANSRARNVLGINKSDVAPNVDESDWTLYDESGTEIPDEDHPIGRALETGETVYGFRHLAEMPNGEKKWLSKNAAPLTDEDGNVSKVVVAIEDITELKEREQELGRRTAELDEAVTELKHSNAELERFAYVASHDLKEPLRMVSNYLGLLERRYSDELDEDAQDFIDYATDGAERMRDLINGLLEYSRTQRHDDDPEPVDVDDVVEEVRSNLQVAIEESDATVETEPLPTVLADRNHLVQLFQNLLSNAITHSEEHAPSIEVSVERHEDRYVFAVADDGVGMDPEQTDQVFDIFYSGESSDSTGIGLAICKKIVETHGGRIWASSEPGEGTTVSFTLPTESADLGDRGPPASAPLD